MYLPKVGTITLIKSTLSNLPKYFTFFPLLACVANCIKLHRGFLWGGLGEEFKFQLVSWSKIYSNFEEMLGTICIRERLFV
jgi:hypothetical protein